MSQFREYPKTTVTLPFYEGNCSIAALLSALFACNSVRLFFTHYTQVSSPTLHYFLLCILIRKMKYVKASEQEILHISNLATVTSNLALQHGYDAREILYIPPRNQNVPSFQHAVNSKDYKDMWRYIFYSIKSHAHGDARMTWRLPSEVLLWIFNAVHMLEFDHLFYGGVYITEPNYKICSLSHMVNSRTAAVPVQNQIIMMQLEPYTAENYPNINDLIQLAANNISKNNPTMQWKSGVIFKVNHYLPFYHVNTGFQMGKDAIYKSYDETWTDSTAAIDILIFERTEQKVFPIPAYLRLQAIDVMHSICTSDRQYYVWLPLEKKPQFGPPDQMVNESRKKMVTRGPDKYSFVFCRIHGVRLFIFVFCMFNDVIFLNYSSLQSNEDMIEVFHVNKLWGGNTICCIAAVDHGTQDSLQVLMILGKSDATDIPYFHNMSQNLEWDDTLFISDEQKDQCQTYLDKANTACVKFQAAIRNTKVFQAREVDNHVLLNNWFYGTLLV